MSIQHDVTPPAERPNELPPENQLVKQEQEYVVQATAPASWEQHLPQPTRADEYSSALAQAYAKAGTLILTKEESEALMAPFPDEQVAVRPHDGLLYIPHILVSDRLTRVLGPGQWTMVRRWEKFEEGVIYAEYVLIIRGVFVGEAIGGQAYQPKNPKMNYSDALEGTQGEALRRICGKRLSLGSQVWSPDYCDSWLSKHGNWTTENGKRVCRKRNIRTQMTPERAEPVKPPSHATQVPKMPEIAVPEPKQTTVASTEPDESPETKRARWLKLLRPLEPVATQLLIESGVLLPNETIEDLPVSKVPLTKAVAAHFIEQCRLRIDGIQAETAPEVTTSDTPPEPPASGDNHEEEWWYKFPVPFGKDKGCPLGKLDKKTLYGWWANYQPEPRTDKNGKTWPVSQSDRDFRRALDFIGSHYEFTKKD